MPFAPPPETNYDLRFKVLGIPVRVHPLFWLMALLFGASARNALDITIWVIAVFVSILVHELGHSMAMRFYRMDSHIVLYHFGGLAISYNPRDENEQLVISFAGPLAGFLLAGLIVAGVYVAGGTVYINWLYDVLPLPIAGFYLGPDWLNVAIFNFVWINIFWGVLNLMPVFPLDGGQIARALFMKLNPREGVRNSLWLSVLTGGFLAVGGIMFLESFYMAFLFGLLAFQSYQVLQSHML